MEIWEIFNRSFEDKKDRKIAIYGIGYNTKLILDNISGYNIVGLLDGIKKSGDLYGLPLLDGNLLSNEAVDMVVIVARSSNIGIILKRIARICNNSGIKVYDVRGKDLLKTDKESEKRYIDSADKEILLRKIKEADVVSFDLFDTLIMRKVLFSSDVFELMMIYDKNLPNDFSEKRIMCERKLVRENNTPSISMIYDELQKIYGWTGEIKEYYAGLEYMTDCKCMIPREEVCGIYRKCCDMQKSIYIISDMYYTEGQIKGILKKFGILSYKGILVSCEKGTAKTGKLFDIYLEKEKEGKKLHIGDDEEADILPAKARGIDTYQILSGRRMLECSRYYELLFYADSLPERTVIGCYAARIFNSPFGIKDGKGIIRDKESYGYLFIAPLILTFCLWMIGKVKDGDIGNILFSSRDGYIVMKVYNYIKSSCIGGYMLPDAAYLYASRIAYVIMSVIDEEDMKFAYKLPYDGNAREMLMERFRLPAEEIEDYTGLQGNDGLEYVLRHSDKIKNRSEYYRKNFFKYISDNDIALNGDTVFFDFVSSGTCQRSLERITGQHLKGYYFSYVRSGCSHNDMDINELFYNKYDCVNDSFLCSHYLYLENIFTSAEPTLKEFDDSGKAVFLTENRTENQLNEIKEIHEGILMFVRDVMKLLNGSAEGELRKEIADKMFSYILDKYTQYNVDMESNGELADEFCRRSFNAKSILWDV